MNIIGFVWRVPLRWRVEQTLRLRDHDRRPVFLYDHNTSKESSR
jgi:hypothetical protein